MCIANAHAYTQTRTQRPERTHSHTHTRENTIHGLYTRTHARALTLIPTHTLERTHTRARAHSQPRATLRGINRLISCLAEHTERWRSADAAVCPHYWPLCCRNVPRTVPGRRTVMYDVSAVRHSPVAHWFDSRPQGAVCVRAKRHRRNKIRGSAMGDCFCHGCGPRPAYLPVVCSKSSYFML